MGYGGGDLTAAGCPWPVIGPLRVACVQAVGGDLSGLAAQFSDESALEVCIHVMRYTNRRLYFLQCTKQVGGRVLTEHSET